MRYASETDGALVPQTGRRECELDHRRCTEIVRGRSRPAILPGMPYDPTASSRPASRRSPTRCPPVRIGSTRSSTTATGSRCAVGDQVRLFTRRGYDWSGRYPVIAVEGIVSKKLSAPYRSGRSTEWLKIKNPDSPAMIRAREGER
jgi:hypothetical protein